MADAGYESLENYLDLERNGQMCFIKPANYEQEEDQEISKAGWAVIENMKYEPEEDSFTCAQGRKLYLRRETTEVQDGQLVSTALYRCEDCSGCPAAPSAAGPRIRTGPRSSFSRKPSGRSGSRQRRISRPSEGSICVFAALFRWKAPLVC